MVFPYTIIINYRFDVHANVLLARPQRTKKRKITSRARTFFSFLLLFLRTHLGLTLFLYYNLFFSSAHYFLPINNNYNFFHIFLFLFTHFWDFLFARWTWIYAVFTFSSHTLVLNRNDTSLRRILQSVAFDSNVRKYFPLRFPLLILHRVFAFDCLYGCFDFSLVLTPSQCTLVEYIFECVSSKPKPYLGNGSTRFPYLSSTVFGLWAVIYERLYQSSDRTELELSFSLSLETLVGWENPDRWLNFYTRYQTVHVRCYHWDTVVHSNCSFRTIRASPTV